MLDHNVVFAFSITLLAGLSTGIGAFISLLADTTNRAFLSLALGFSSGVMLYLSFMEILPQAQVALSQELGGNTGSWYTLGAFMTGCILVAVIDKLVPESHNPHECRSVELMEYPQEALPKDTLHDFSRLKRTGFITALAIAVHNFPEGMATFVAALHDPTLGVVIAGAVGIHNIPEGIAVAVPLYFATGSKRLAFLYSFLSGLAEPLGALLFYLILMPFFSSVIFGLLFAGIAGVMVYISLGELLPAAREYASPHLCMYGGILGMLVIGISLILLR